MPVQSISGDGRVCVCVSLVLCHPYDNNEREKKIKFTKCQSFNLKPWIICRINYYLNCNIRHLLDTKGKLLLLIFNNLATNLPVCQGGGQGGKQMIKCRYHSGFLVYLTFYD